MAEADMADVKSSVGQGKSASFVEWSAVFAGAAFAAALSFVLLTFGSWIGLSFVSPWGSGASAKLVASLTVFWTMAQYILCFMIGGYIAGQLRRRWAEATADEVEFRDGLHGGLVWALGIIISALLLLATAGTIARAGSDVSARVAGGATSQSVNPVSYVTDVLLRAAAPRAEGAPSTTTVTPSDLRAEVGRVLVRAIANGELSQDDRSYLASLVSQRTGLGSRRLSSESTMHLPTPVALRRRRLRRRAALRS